VATHAQKKKPFQKDPQKIEVATAWVIAAGNSVWEMRSIIARC
jgi:hypothetical protein